VHSDVTCEEVGHAVAVNDPQRYVIKCLDIHWTP